MTNSRVFLISILAAVALLASSGGTAQDGSPKGQNSELPPVTLSLIVTDLSDHSIDTLRKEDIQLLEDGIPQPISFLSKDDRPVGYGIAIDRSGSFRRVLQPAIDAAKSIVKGNRPGDETFIETFVNGEKIETVQDFTANKNYLFDGLDSLFVDPGYSAITDAVYLAVEHIAKHRKGTDDRRRALVLITDGDDRNNFYDHPALKKLLNEQDVQIFVLGFISEVKIKPTDEERLKGYRTRDEATAFLTGLAEDTGGRAFFPNGINDLERAASEIDRDLRNKYSIAYQPTERKPGFHKIRVEITAGPGKEKLIAITRPGYFVPSAEKPKDKKPK